MLDENPTYEKLDEETAETISVLMGVKDFMEHKKELSNPTVTTAQQTMQSSANYRNTISRKSRSMENSANPGITRNTAGQLRLSCIRKIAAKSFTKNLAKKCNSSFASCIFYVILCRTIIMGVFAVFRQGPGKSFVFI